MQLNNLCAPAMLYVVFSITQIIIDIFKSLYNTAFLKFLVMIVFTIALNLLCQMGLGVVSWFIVFVPFIMMTIITSLLLFVLGLSPSKGRNRVKVDHPDRERARHREEARHHRAEERIHHHEAKLKEQTHHWREKRRHEEERHQREKRHQERIHRHNQHRRHPSRHRRHGPYDYHDGDHHGDGVLYEEFDGYDTDGTGGSDVWEYHEIRPVNVNHSVTQAVNQ